MKTSPFKSIPFNGLEFHALASHHHEALLNLILAFDAAYSPRGLYSERIAQRAVNSLYKRYLDSSAKPSCNQYWLIFHPASQTYIGGIGLGPRANTAPEAGVAGLRDVLIHPQWQGEHLGKSLLSWLIPMTQKLGYQQLYLEAEAHTATEEAYFNHRDAGLRFFRHGKKLRVICIPQMVQQVPQTV